jgi:hypothetical protein
MVNVESGQHFQEQADDHQLQREGREGGQGEVQQAQQDQRGGGQNPVHEGGSQAPRGVFGQLLHDTPKKELKRKKETPVRKKLLSDGLVQQRISFFRENFQNSIPTTINRGQKRPNGGPYESETEDNCVIGDTSWDRQVGAEEISGRMNTLSRLKPLTI